jgi:predicted DNA-binding antitoxin AbrB/MazE fold protein
VGKDQEETMINVSAVFENGLLKPTEPLELTEGEMVELTVGRPNAPTPITEWERKLQAAKSIQEWVALANACPDPGPNVDIVEVINETRRLTGFRMPDPEPNGGESK